MSLIYFPIPILATEMRLTHLTYTGNPVGSNPFAKYDDGHNIKFETELFGCDNYDINEGEMFFSKQYGFRGARWSCGVNLRAREVRSSNPAQASNF